MKESSINSNQFFISNHKPSEVAEPGKSTFHFPSSLESPEFSAVLKFLFLPIFTMRSNQIYSTNFEILTKRIAVICFISNQAFRSLLRSALSLARHIDCLKRLADQLYFRGRCRGKGASHRKTLAVCHHHPLRTFSLLGFPDAGPPFFAGAKLPSMKASCQSSAPLASNCAKKARHTSSQTPCSSQSLSLRQQVEALGYTEGKSHHRAPVRNIHRIPSRTFRLSAGGLPPFGVALRLGNKGSIRCHCSSFKKLRISVIGSPPMTIYLNLKEKSSRLTY